MAVYYYTARTDAGAQLSGSLEAPTRDEALGHLRARALFVTSVESTDSAGGALAFLRLYTMRGPRQRAAFFRGFATLAGAGVSLRRALETLMLESRDAVFAETLRSIVADVDRGVALSSAAARHPREFSRVALAMMRAGEEGGTLDASLYRIADLEERAATVRKRLTSALAYPAIVTAAALGLVGFLVANTMPAFASMFSQMHVDLPPSTRALIAAGALLSTPQFWIASIVVVAGLFAGQRYARRRELAPALWLEFLASKAPVVGTIRTKSEIAAFARTLGSLLHSGVIVIAALEAARDVTGSLLFRRGSRDVADALRRGDSLHQALAGSELFDATFLQLIRAGEESGALDAMLLRLADYYDVDVETALATLGSVLEPALICILGAIVGTIVASVIVPLYSMIGSIR